MGDGGIPSWAVKGTRVVCIKNTPGKTLPKGVSRGRKRFTATIKANGVRYHLGTFDDPISAGAAYAEMATKLHGEFARTT